MSTTPSPTLPNALAFAARGHAVFPIWGNVNGKCGCGTECGRDACKHLTLLRLTASAAPRRTRPR